MKDVFEKILDIEIKEDKGEHKLKFTTVNFIFKFLIKLIIFHLFFRIAKMYKNNMK